MTHAKGGNQIPLSRHNEPPYCDFTINNDIVVDGSCRISAMASASIHRTVTSSSLRRPSHLCRLGSARRSPPSHIKKNLRHYRSMTGTSAQQQDSQETGECSELPIPKTSTDPALDIVWDDRWWAASVPPAQHPLLTLFSQENPKHTLGSIRTAQSARQPLERVVKGRV